MKELPQNHFIETFIKQLDNTLNKEYLIENEIEQIKLFVSSKGKPIDVEDPLLFEKDTHSVFNLSWIMGRELFNIVYHNYLLYGEFESAINEEAINAGILEDEEVYEACLFADYYQWLKSLKLDSLQIQPKKSDFTHKQKVLALYYLGLDINNPDVTNSALAKALGKILGLDEGNTRKYLTYVSGGENEVRTEKNLKAVQKLFLDSNLDTYANVIEKELNSIKKKTIK